MKTFTIIAAVDEEWGIGKDGAIPWNCPEDLQFFKELTTETSCMYPQEQFNAIIMGRKTWESLPRKPLPGRLNLVISRNNSLGTSFEEALNTCASFGSKLNKIYVIGGAEVYQTALESPYCTDAYITFIKGKYNCDTFFPKQKLQSGMDVMSLYHKKSETSLIYDICYFYR